MITVNATLVLQMIQFIILVFILNRLMLRPLLKVINERAKYTENTKEETRDIELKIKELKEQFLFREISARKEAAKERSDIVDVGVAKAEAFLNSSRQEISSIRIQSTKRIEAETKEVRPLLREQAESLVGVIMEKTIGRRAGA